MTIGRHVAKLSGYAPELPTPFDDRDRICQDEFARLCHLQITNGATALVVGGVTGEAANLRSADRAELVRIAAGVSGGQVPVIADATSNATARAIELAREAEVNGADAILSVVPCYNKPTQQGLLLHFSAIVGATSLPVLVGDVPLRTARGLADETVTRLAELPQVIGVVDASGDIARPARLRASVGQQFRLFSGDDGSALGYIAQGGDGCISVVSNAAPGLCRELFLALRHGQPARVARMAQMLASLTVALSAESSPAPLKFALSMFGLMSPRLRLPLVELNDSAKAAVASILIRFCDERSDLLIGAIGGAPVRFHRRA
jgi:4-hydroxy-tetrahydrodipicolinate synthase